MKEYIVKHSNGETETFYRLASAKSAIKADNGAKGFIYKIYFNGDFEPCGEIKMKGNNATLMAGATRQTKANYV